MQQRFHLGVGNEMHPGFASHGSSGVVLKRGAPTVAGKLPRRGKRLHSAAHNQQVSSGLQANTGNRLNKFGFMLQVFVFFQALGKCLVNSFYLQVEAFEQGFVLYPDILYQLFFVAFQALNAQL